MQVLASVGDGLPPGQKQPLYGLFEGAATAGLPQDVEDAVTAALAALKPNWSPAVQARVDGLFAELYACVTDCLLMHSRVSW